jgi:hypothetical protein
LEQFPAVYMYGEPGPGVVNDWEVLDKVDFYESQAEESHSCINARHGARIAASAPCFPLSRNVT